MKGSEDDNERSIAANPEVLIMDEPFGALDAQTRRTLQDELIRIWKKTGKTILFVTHDISEAVYLGENISIFSVAPDASIVEKINVPYIYPRDVNDKRIGDFIKYTTEKLENAIRSSKEKHEKVAKLNAGNVASYEDDKIDKSIAV